MLLKRNYCSVCGHDYNLIGVNDTKEYICYMCEFPPFGSKWIVPDKDSPHVLAFCKKILNG